MRTFRCSYISKRTKNLTSYMEKKSLCFSNTESEAAQTSQTEKFQVSLHANRRPSLPPSPLLWNIRAMLSYVKNKSNAVYLEIPDNMCDMRHIYRNSAQCCQLCKREGLQWKTDCAPKTCSQNIPWSTALNLQFRFSAGVIWTIKLGAATQRMKTHPCNKNLTQVHRRNHID